MTAKDWLVLSLLPGLGPRRIQTLRERAPECLESWPEGWLALLPRPAATALRLWLDHPDRSPLAPAVDALDGWLAASAHHALLHPGHSCWPALLDELPDPPVVLWACGDLAALKPPALAIVGSRRPTRDGLESAAAFGRDLAGEGYATVSGMALGIDGAAEKSGSLVSARLAMEQNREVFALPGSIHNPQARGCLGLIRQGATLVTGIEDILDELPPRARASTIGSTDAPARTSQVTHAPAASDAGPQDPLLELLSERPTPLDVLVELTGQGVGHCQRRLLELEIDGLVTQTVGGWVRLSGRLL